MHLNGNGKSLRRKVKKGDLVRFESGVSTWHMLYKEKNPGIVLKIIPRVVAGNKQASAEVLWSNKEITTEHIGYLNILE